MVNKKREDVGVDDTPNVLEEIQNELPMIIKGHGETGDAIQRCVDVCGPFRNKKIKKKRISKVASIEVEKVEEVPVEVKPVDPIEERKKELLREMSTIGMGQVAKLKRLLKKIEELNEEAFRATLAAPMARHELMTLLAEQGLRLPLWVSPVGEHPPPLVGAIGANDAYKLAVGDYCAAYCEDMWILGEVRGIADNGRYEVRDVDDSEKPFTILARRRVIPLPRYRADPQRDWHAIFPKNAWILALYPQTTVFYKGIVEEPPKTATEPYKVSFDDSTFHGGFSPPLEVPQRYVVSFREVAYKPRGSAVEKVELSKEELREQREAERERKKMERAEEREREKIRRKEEKKAEKERIKREKKEAKQREKERLKKERKAEKSRLAKERRLQRKQEEKERKEAEKKAAESGEKDETAEEGSARKSDEDDLEKKRKEEEKDEVDVEDEEEADEEEEEDADDEEEEEEEIEDEEAEDEEVEEDEKEVDASRDNNDSSEDEI